MANEEHVDEILQGPQNWNDYTSRSMRASGVWHADLSRAKLVLADLGGANLTGANLRGANLGGANLRGANLGGADLTDANLTRANLTRANLTGANLEGSDLTRANLIGADLTRAALDGANLTDAIATGSDLDGANLTGKELHELDKVRASADRMATSGARALREIGTMADLPEEGPRGELLVELEVPLGPAETADVVVGIVTAIGVLADLAVTVGPRLDPGGPSLGGAGGGTALLTAAESRDPIRVRSLRYGSPLSIDLAESVPPAVAVALVVKDLLKGPDKSGLLSMIFTLFNPKEITAFGRARVARREADAAQEQARKREADQRGWQFTAQPASQDAVAERVAEATAGDAEASRAITERLVGLEPLTDRSITVTAILPALPGDQSPPPAG